ncbi:GntP family permease [Mycolicibacterium smegmatis]|uniref:GntP family permease n=1 Tax=Mycolicibacterium smegmatis TaxID=1772 RepID=UPI0005D88FD5|nr:GntP family permease [Mycolicibacterium smegmatis]MDF1897849.1 GntP family permease [Mycolicibacterium smegmatis]MDF1904405.1 GntP family permease [Mycolicibacterium smegmatis]MDF1917620.1 GntP family permease [Mycolicibacterium smegmatis]MDF1922977.1 GntP family permease [Mycolicibacterium smegmatis]UAK58108.1 GntP family permease [Mycolicibacterium smegmatis]
MDEITLAERPAALLVVIALVAIAVLLFLIIKVRLHAFFSLIVVSVLTGLAAGISMGDVINVVIAGFSNTVGSVALLVGFGAVLGRLVEMTGGAQVLADKMLDRFGEKRAPLALAVASLFYAFPIFLDAGFIVMLPIIYTVARRLGGSFMLYVLPSIGAFLMMHALTPPHPGPTAAATVMGADVGMVVIVALLVGLPTWYLAGYRLSLIIAKRYPNMPVPNLLGEPKDYPEDERPGFWTVILVLLLPLVLIFFNTVFSTLEADGAVTKDNIFFQLSRLIGTTSIALLISVLLAMVLLYIRPRRRRNERIGGLLEDLVDDALAPVCSIILITGAGGAFGRILTETGIGKTLADGLDAFGLPVILAGFLIAIAFRVAQGSATVAATTAGSIMAPAVAELNLTGVALAAIVVAIAAGSITFSHVNDSGFWLVGRFCGFDTVTTLKTWTVVGTAIGFMSFVLATAVYLVAS